MRASALASTAHGTHSIVLVIAALVVAGCGGSTVLTEELSAPGVVRCQATVSGMPAALSPASGRATLTVSAARDCGWTATSDVSWVTLSPTSGQGDGSITVSVEENTEPSSRTGAIRVNGIEVAVTQREAPCRFDIDRDRANVAASGGRVSVRVTANAASCRWSATSTAAWARPADTATAGSGMAAFDVDANRGPVRTAALQVAGHPIELTQASDQPTTPAPSPSPGPSPAPPSPSPPPAPSPSPPSPAPEPRPNPPQPPPGDDEDGDEDEEDEEDEGKGNGNGKNEDKGKGKDKDKDEDD